MFLVDMKNIPTFLASQFPIGDADGDIVHCVFGDLYKYMIQIVYDPLTCKSQSNNSSLVTWHEKPALADESSLSKLCRLLGALLVGLDFFQVGTDKLIDYNAMESIL